MSESIQTLKERIEKDRKRLGSLLAAQTRRQNAKFAKMTRAERAVVVAKDVLMLLGQGKIEAKTGTYFRSFDPVLDIIPTESEADVQLQEKFEQMETCNACAIGSLFVAKVCRFDALTVEEADVYYGNIGDEIMRDQLDQIFTCSQLSDIERAFEVDGRWKYTYENDEERLIAIMKNIIRNKGTFKMVESDYDNDDK